MNTLGEILNQVWTPRTGWTLAHFIWQGALIAGLLWLALRLLARRAPQVRRLVTALAMLLIVAAPVLTFSLLKPPATARSQPETLNPVITFNGQSFYLCESINAKLPSHVRVGWNPGLDGTATYYLFRLANGTVTEQMEITPGIGFLADLTGDGVDELVMGRLPNSKSLRVTPVDVYGALRNADGTITVPGLVAPATLHDIVYDIHPTHKLAILLNASYTGTVTAASTVAPVDAKTKTAGSWTSHGIHWEFQWEDLYGTGQPVRCKVATHSWTDHPPQGQPTDRTQRKLEAYWRLDPRDSLLIETATDVALPLEPQPGEFTRLLKEVPPPSPRPGTS